ncbi:hypothetical protein IFM89_026316 [Coptis chinensis]|uniref:Pentatricopeptide repeat-containing protein n=1 Tax=Coptis chinensis TaxID=261450 RepID=A0A835I3M9_9MAGN|nr:hypothetical protein IFM89_026316 [Coptis chinensis]
MPRRDVVSWNAMLACYAQSGKSNEVMELFNEMRDLGVKPTEATVVSLSSACWHLGALDQGASLHAYISEHKIGLTTIMGTTLVDMYARCGSISLATEVFYSIELKDVLTWNTIITGMAMHGHAAEALRLFKEMQEAGVCPDDITFVAMLSACSQVEKLFHLTSGHGESMVINQSKASVHRCKAIIDMKEKERLVYPAVMNDETLHEHVEMVGRHLLGSENVKLCNKVLASEDFAFYQEVIPGVILPSTRMKPQFRILHRILFSTILPKCGHFNHINDFGLYLINAMRKGDKLDLVTIIWHNIVEHSGRSKKNICMPHGILISKIITGAGVPPHYMYIEQDSPISRLTVLRMTSRHVHEQDSDDNSLIEVIAAKIKDIYQLMQSIKSELDIVVEYLRKTYPNFPPSSLELSTNISFHEQYSDNDYLIVPNATQTKYLSRLTLGTKSQLDLVVEYLNKICTNFSSSLELSTDNSFQWRSDYILSDYEGPEAPEEDEWQKRVQVDMNMKEDGNDNEDGETEVDGDSEEVESEADADSEEVESEADGDEE